MGTSTPLTEVDTFLKALAHPQEPTIRRLRAVVLAADPRIGEGIKWNAPSFHLEERHFATMQLRHTDRVLLVLHLGATKRAIPKGAITDAEKRLTWLGADRATWSASGVHDVDAHAAALQLLLRQWMAHA